MRETTRKEETRKPGTWVQVRIIAFREEKSSLSFLQQKKTKVFYLEHRRQIPDP